MSEEATRTNGFELDAAKAEAVREALIPRFEENGRDLPWRRTRDPWRVLVSEVMLQQIQVARGPLLRIVRRPVPHATGPLRGAAL